MNKELLMEDCMCEPCEAGGSYDVNMEPDDIEVSDQKAFPSIQIGGIGYRIPKDTFDSWLHQKESGER